MSIRMKGAVGDQPSRTLSSNRNRGIEHMWQMAKSEALDPSSTTCDAAQAT